MVALADWLQIVSYSQLEKLSSPIGHDLSHWSFRAFRLEILGDATCLKIFHSANDIATRVWSLVGCWSPGISMELHIGILIVYQYKFRDQHFNIRSIGRKYIRIIIGCKIWIIENLIGGKYAYIFYSNHMKSTLLAQDLYTCILKSTHLGFPT